MAGLRAGALTRLVADVRPLRDNPAFRRMWAGGAVSNLGGNMTSFAVVLQIWDVSHSSLAVGALGLAQFVPVLVFGLVAGSLADAADRRRLYLIVSCWLAVVSAATSRPAASLR
jgi:MFS family permease